MAVEQVTTITKDNFESLINDDKPLLVDFWASWCGPCRTVAPVIDDIAVEFDGKIKVGKLNVDEEGELAAQYRVMSIPTIILFKKGQVVDKIIGARPKEDFKKMINNNL